MVVSVSNHSPLSLKLAAYFPPFHLKPASNSWSFSLSHFTEVAFGNFWLNAFVTSTGAFTLAKLIEYTNSNAITTKIFFLIINPKNSKKSNFANL
jgi:hypothetical protein